MPTSQSYDLAVVGAGICGLAHALAAARRRKRVVVIDRDAQANGASIRNFGFITVTGQQAGKCWRRAKRRVEGVESRSPMRRRSQSSNTACLRLHGAPEARAVIEAFLETDMGAECLLVQLGRLNDYSSGLRADSKTNLNEAETYCYREIVDVVFRDQHRHADGDLGDQRSAAGSTTPALRLRIASSSID